MRKMIVIGSVAGLAAAVAVGALVTRSPEARRTISPVAAPVDLAPEPARITAARSAVRLPTGTVVQDDKSSAAEAAQRPEAADEGPGAEWRRRQEEFFGDKPLGPEEFAKFWAERRERWQGQRQRWQDMRQEFDLDGDGVLSEEEEQAMRDAMRERMRARMLERMAGRFDADGDGVLNDEERAEAEAEMEARRVEWRVRMTERFDADGDGTLSEAEEAVARQAEAGGPGRRGPGDWQRVVEQYDQDADGDLNLDESYEAYLDRFEQVERDRFVRRYDADQTGAVDAADLESFLVRYQANDPETDVNRDGVLNQIDVDRFRDLMMNNQP